MNFKTLAIAICLIPFYLTNVARAQQLSNSTRWNSQSQLPSTSQSRPQLSSISQFERLIQRELQQKSPLFYRLLIELEQYQRQQLPDLQQQAEEEILEILERPQPLQKQMIQQQ